MLIVSPRTGNVGGIIPMVTALGKVSVGIMLDTVQMV